MAKYYYPVIVHHRCGHSEKYQLAGNKGSRALESQKMSANDCSSCSKKKLERRMTLEQKDKNLSLPSLTGSYAQITWAMDIRQKLYATLQEKGLEHIAIVEIIGRRTLARWWIENHKKSSVDLWSLLTQIEEAA